MLLPQMWGTKLWLQWALKDYPIYDPPHKVEERVLSKEQALENFDYFMRVRQQRVESFRWWLRRYFWTVTQADENGVRALDRWAVSYAGLLLRTGKWKAGITLTIRRGREREPDAMFDSTWGLRLASLSSPIAQSFDGIWTRFQEFARTKQGL